MAKPKITLAARILLLKEHLETLRNDERDAAIEAHQAFDEVRANLEFEISGAAGLPTAEKPDWDKLRSRMWKSHAIHAYIQGQIDALRNQIKTLEG
ncbi:hypothetical protein UFOVP807_1 [uncultured Caudovirales phage]|uniref:Uncharacterized protein n=1 Tax=uncultured Caudovirales phage TaxID=2100421 RepID=A0A6J5P1J6_9CAUD|nr:hypothetical protein UFOVP339_40 [uncultured Caudovirales phage]CAB4163208.1 hypothetical protein UFOVP807_1 [uncultured Caudovirales phage]